MTVDFQHPANAGIVRYLRDARGADSVSIAASLPSVSPAEVEDPYYKLGAHPDLVEWFWNGLSRKLPMQCNWIVYGTPALVHPARGIIFGFAGGTHTYALRLPEPLREAALQVGAKRIHKYPEYPGLGIAASELNLDDIGPEWFFGGWRQEEVDWCLAAYRFAEDS